MEIPIFSCCWACHYHPTETIKDNQHFIANILVIIATVDLCVPGFLVNMVFL